MGIAKTVAAEPYQVLDAFEVNGAIVFAYLTPEGRVPLPAGTRARLFQQGCYADPGVWSIPVEIRANDSFPYATDAHPKADACVIGELPDWFNCAYVWGGGYLLEPDRRQRRGDG